MAYTPGTLGGFGSGFHVVLSGQQAFRAALNGWREGARVIGGARATFGTNLVYGFGIETGFSRGGRLARKAGGAYYIRDATAEGIAFLAVALPAFFSQPQLGGAGRLLEAFYSILEVSAKVRVPVVTGALKESIRVKPFGGGAVFGTRGG